MNIPAAKLLALLDATRSPEVRAAALLVLGELGLRDNEIGATVVAHLDDPTPAVRLEAIKTIGKLRIASALPQLLERIKVGGPESEPAAHAAAALGVKAIKALQEMMHKVAPGLRKYVAAALGGAGTGSGAGDAVAVLLDRDPAIVEAAVRSLIVQVPDLTATQRKHLARDLLELVERDESLTPASELGLVRLLGALDEPGSAPVFWERLQAGHPVTVRSAALQGLGKGAIDPNKEQFRRLLACATDRDFRIAAPTLMLLKGLPIKKGQLDDWLTLFQAHDVTVRQFAVEQLGDQDTVAVAEALLQQLWHPDKSLREAALKHLQKLDNGWVAFLDALLKAETPERAWQMARAIVPVFRDDEANRQAIFSQVCAFVDAGDRRADALLFVLREVGAGDLKQRLEDRAVALRKKKNYAGALLYLRLLTRDPACGFAMRLEHAACALKLSAKDLAAESRTADLCLEEFITMYRHHQPELFAALEKVKWLDPEDLYYLGFHCAEQQGAIRKLGRQVLELVVERAGKTKIAQAAKSKLKSLVE